MRHTIITKFLGATNHRGSRIKATSERVSVTIGYDHAISSHGAHRAAAQALTDKINKNPHPLATQWKLSDDDGEMPDGSGYAFYLV